MSVGYNIEEHPGHQKVVVEHPSRHTIESESEERHRAYNRANESAAQRASAHAGSAAPNLNDHPLAASDVPSSPSSLDGWSFLEVKDGVPSLTSAPSIETAIPKKDTPEEDHPAGLTTSTLLAHNDSIDLAMGKASVEVKKGSATCISTDSGWSYVPVDDYADSVVGGAGAWAIDYPRSADEITGDIVLE